MTSVSAKKKIRITKVQVSSTEAVKTFEIKLPANASKITAITVTTDQ
ncbi:MAG TPA: hypothetical protein VK750_07320 [Cytophagaceae bacterium]|jgi:hypothetical protein|nr:hypothetical protein [Cytophagaceae bacterium]